MHFLNKQSESVCILSVLDPGKGVCADPVNGGAILGKGDRILIVGTESVSWPRTKEEGRRDP